MSRKVTDRIVVHCAYTPSDMDIGVKEIDRWHRARGFLKVGYHYVIRRDGTVETGRRVDEVGAHAKGWNARSVGICLVGGAARKPDGSLRDEENYTAAQWHSLTMRVHELVHQHYDDAFVVGHYQLDSGKTCPVFDVPKWARANGFPTLD